MGGEGVHKATALSVAAMASWPVEFVTQLGLVVLRHVSTFLQLVVAVGKRTLIRSL